MDASKRWPIWPEAVNKQLDPGFQTFKDVMDGLAVYFEEPFIRDIRDAVLTYPESNIGVALNKKQTACKKWLIEELFNCVGSEIGVVHVLAGWYGVLSAFLLNDSRFKIDQIVSIDRDETCRNVAGALNATHVKSGRFRFEVGDIYDLNYCPDIESNAQPFTPPDLIINTSCEHLDRFEKWLDNIPEGMLLALQSNNYWAIPEHVNSVETIEDFMDQVGMNELMFSGQLDLEKYSRFMLIGRK